MCFSVARMSSIVSSSVEKRRRAYQCLRCYHKLGKRFVEARYRVMAHFLKQHMGLDEVPFYCTLCLFRSFKREDLEAHVRTFPRHQMMLKEKGVTDGKEMLISNPRPYQITDKDVIALSEEESRNHWDSLAKKKAPVNLLSLAIDETFPGGIPDLSPAKTAATVSAMSETTGEAVPRISSAISEPVQVTATAPCASPCLPTSPQILHPGMQSHLSLMPSTSHLVGQSTVPVPAQVASPPNPATFVNPGLWHLQQLLLSAFQQPSGQMLPVPGSSPAVLPTMQGGNAVEAMHDTPVPVKESAGPLDKTIEVITTKQPAPKTSQPEVEDILQDILPTNMSTSLGSHHSPSQTSSSSSSSIPSSASSLGKRKLLDELQSAVEANTRALLGQEVMLKELMTCVMDMSYAIRQSARSATTRATKSTQTNDEETKEGPSSKRRREDRARSDGSRERPRVIDHRDRRFVRQKEDRGHRRR